jgi:hypothetical protein
VKVGLVGGWADAHLVAPSYVAAREPAERFGGRLLAEAARRGALGVASWVGGAIESAADRVVQQRMKPAGMRWSAADGDVLLALRARVRSHRPLLLPTARPVHHQGPRHARAA